MVRESERARRLPEAGHCNPSYRAGCLDGRTDSTESVCRLPPVGRGLAGADTAPEYSDAPTSKRVICYKNSVSF